MNTKHEDRQLLAMKTLDIDWVRQQAADAGDTPLSDDVILCALHKSRYEVEAIPKELRHESGHWLRKKRL